MSPYSSSSRRGKTSALLPANPHRLWTHEATPPTKTELIADLAGERLDVFVARRLDGVTRSHVQRLIESGNVRVSGEPAKASLRLEVGQPVAVDVPPPVADRAEPEPIPLDVIFEDADLLVINKPAGMTVHPSPGHRSATLVNAILAHCSDLSGIGGVLRPGIVHRLDRDTSGVIVVAKNDVAHEGVARQLKERRVEKTYVALVQGTPRPPEGVIDAPIARDPRNRQRMAVIDDGRPSETAYRVVERFRGTALVEARPRTGRTHQIRVHLAAIGHPIIGDRLYGTPSDVVARQFLHAMKIVLTHPRTGARMEFEAPMPLDLTAPLASVRAGE